MTLIKIDETYYVNIDDVHSVVLETRTGEYDLYLLKLYFKNSNSITVCSSKNKKEVMKRLNEIIEYRTINII